MPELTAEQQKLIFRSFAKWLAIAITAIVALPMLYGYAIRPPGTLYLGIQTNLDDHMVYAGWMKQAAEGHLTFENRFTTDPQPGLTLHLYYLVLGWISKIAGIPLTMTLARLGFTFLSVILLGRLVEFVTDRIYPRKLALTMAVVGGGIGFLVWHNFGKAIVKPGNDFLTQLMLSRLPTDVWQPEGFFFFSALTNSLFMVSLCLILGIFISILKAKENSKAVIPGAICFGLLMNIHSYDVLLIVLVLLGFVATLLGSKLIDAIWVKRAVMIGLGALPFALWFVYVLNNDPVFRSRAATLTYSPNFRQIFAGYVLLIVPALYALYEKRKLSASAIGIMGLVFIGLNVAAASHLGDEYFMSPIVWASTYGLILVSLFLLRPQKPGVALIAAWALVGIIAPYFPALFQRKLTMMLSVPWGILAGIGIAMILEKRERGQRNLLTALGIIVIASSGIYWLKRETTLAKMNVSSTTVHSIYYSSDVTAILDILRPLGAKATVAALPGIPSPSVSETGMPIIDSYDTPVIPDLNPIFVGLAGSKTFAGHWSETPNYESKRKELGAMLRSETVSPNPLGVTHFVFPTDHLPKNRAPEEFGEVLYKGREFTLIKAK